MYLKVVAACAAIAGAALAGCAQQQPQEAKPAVPQVAAKQAAGFAAMPPKKDSGLKMYYADGRILNDAAALSRMQQDAELILWLAGNQFFALDDVVPPISSTVRTLEETERNQILKTLSETGWRIEGKDGAAAILGLHPSTLRSRMHKLGILRPEAKEPD